MQLFAIDILHGSLITDNAAVSVSLYFSLSFGLSLYFAFVHFDTLRCGSLITVAAAVA